MASIFDLFGLGARVTKLEQRVAELEEQLDNDILEVEEADDDE